VLQIHFFVQHAWQYQFNDVLNKSLDKQFLMLTLQAILLDSCRRHCRFGLQDEPMPSGGWVDHLTSGRTVREVRC
jgi:hypothetical protein